jgi:hypothetical protein
MVTHLTYAVRRRDLGLEKEQSADGPACQFRELDIGRTPGRPVELDPG